MLLNLDVIRSHVAVAAKKCPLGYKDLKSLIKFDGLTTELNLKIISKIVLRYHNYRGAFETYTSLHRGSNKTATSNSQFGYNLNSWTEEKSIDWDFL